MALGLSFLTACAADDKTIHVALASSMYPVQASLEASAAQVGNQGVSMTSDGSATLVTQVREGRPTDIIVTADAASLVKLASAGAIDGRPVPLATNHLVLAVSADNPAAIQSLDDLQRENVFSARCAVEVPCGKLAVAVLEDSQIALNLLTETQNVSAVVALVTSGEADAGFVYSTDVKASNGALVAVPDERLSGAVATVTGAVIQGAKHRSQAKEILEFWASPQFSQVWHDAGFTPLAGF